MPAPELRTVGDVIAWSYANLACAHAAVRDGRVKHTRTDWMIRAKLFRGLREGSMRMGGLFDDERLQLIAAPRCAYCGEEGSLAIDHLIPRAAGGKDDGHNLVRACRPCNSSKGKRDLMDWYASRGEFPPLLLLRRYLKIVAHYSEHAGVMGYELNHSDLKQLPFTISQLPIKYPSLRELRL